MNLIDIYNCFFIGSFGQSTPLLKKERIFNPKPLTFFLGEGSRKKDDLLILGKYPMIPKCVINQNRLLWSDRSRRSRFINGISSESAYRKDIELLLRDNSYIFEELRQNITNRFPQNYINKNSFAIYSRIIYSYFSTVNCNFSKSIISKLSDYSYLFSFCILYCIIKKATVVNIFSSFLECSNSYTSFHSTNNVPDTLNLSVTSNDLHFSKTLKKLGYENIFIPFNNSDRSKRKGQLLKTSKRIDLVSRTGNSFLGNIGNRYRDIILDNISNYNTYVHILLLSPWSNTAITTAFSESNNPDIFLKYISGNMNEQEIIAEYLSSNWYKTKYSDVINGYLHLLTITNNIELRFIDYDITASILITDSSVFFEPYFNSISNSRMGKIVSTFELELKKNNSFFSQASNFFNLLWGVSKSYNDIIQAQNIYLNKLTQQLSSSTLFYISVHAIIRKDNLFLITKRSFNNDYLPNIWDIPGGEVQPGETLSEALHREVYEETRLTIAVKNFSYAFTNFSELPFRQTLQLIFECTYISGEIHLSPKEHADYAWIHQNDLVNYNIIEFLKKMEQIT